MTNGEVGAALVVSAALGLGGYSVCQLVAPTFTHGFLSFWLVATVGLCIIAGDSDDD